MIGLGVDAVLDLSGDPLTRGRGQAKAGPALVAAARAAIRARLDDARETLARDDVQRFLAEQARITARHDPAASAEIAGIATALELDVSEVFAHLHLGAVADQVADSDGCSAFAARGLLAKNRDYRGRHLLPQVVYRLADPAWGGRRVLCLGSLGAPGAYSSGLNSDGLALADTQIGARDCGPGLLRYFVMTRLLAECADLPTALDLLRSLTHAGGGSLVLADEAGRIAAVELGHSRVAIEQGDWVARSNHFVSPDLSGATRAGDAPAQQSTQARLATLRAALGDAESIDFTFARRLLTDHGRAHETLCRHGEGQDSLTLAAVVIDPAARSLSLAASPPCRGVWQDFTFTSEGS